MFTLFKKPVRVLSMYRDWASRFAHAHASQICVLFHLLTYFNYNLFCEVKVLLDSMIKKYLC